MGTSNSINLDVVTEASALMYNNYENKHVYCYRRALFTRPNRGTVVVEQFQDTLYILYLGKIRSSLVKYRTAFRTPADSRR